MFRSCLIWIACASTALAGDPLQEFLFGEEINGDPQILRELSGGPPPVEDQREVVNIWTASWCGPCRRLHTEVDGSDELPFRINWIDADKVPMSADVPVGIPHAEWADRRWYTKPRDLQDLVGRYQRSKDPKPKASKPVNAVSGQAAGCSSCGSNFESQFRPRRGKRGR